MPIRVYSLQVSFFTIACILQLCCHLVTSISNFKIATEPAGVYEDVTCYKVVSKVCVYNFPHWKLHACTSTDVQKELRSYMRLTYLWCVPALSCRWCIDPLARCHLRPLPSFLRFHPRWLVVVAPFRRRLFAPSQRLWACLTFTIAVYVVPRSCAFFVVSL